MKTPVCPSVLAVALVAACGAAHAADTVVRTVDEGGIRDQWTLASGATLATPQYPVDVARSAPVDACMALGYRIAPDGTTSDFRVLKQWNNASGELEPVDGAWASFAQTAADAVSQWKFAPRANATPEAVYTVATLTWRGRNVTDARTLQSHCRITNLAAQISRATPNEDLTDELIDKQYRLNDAVRRAPEDCDFP